LLHSLNNRKGRGYKEASQHSSRLFTLERKEKDMKISEALAWIDNSIDYWVEVSEYEGKEKDVKKTDKARTVIVKTLKEKGVKIK